MYMTILPQNRIKYYLRTLKIINPLIYSAIYAETSVIHTILHGLVQLQVNSKLARMWKYEVILTSFTGNLMKGKPRKKIIHNCNYPERFWNRAPPQYKSEESDVEPTFICHPMQAQVQVSFKWSVSLLQAVGLQHFWLLSIVCIMSVAHATFAALFIKDVTSTGE